MGEYLEKEYGGKKLQKKAATPFPRDYRPELETSPELDPENANIYQSKIGV